MLKKIKKNIKSDTGASATVELMFIILFLFVILVTVIDFGLYFSNRNVITNSAQNGARLAAVYGGSGDTPVARQYGSTKVSPTCSQSGASDNVSCAVLTELLDTKGLTNVDVYDVNCGPSATQKIGERTYCEITWSYRGVPGSSMALVGFYDKQTTKMTAESEVVTK